MTILRFPIAPVLTGRRLPMVEPVPMMPSPKTAPLAALSAKLNQRAASERTPPAAPRRYPICFVTRSDLMNHDRRIRHIGGVNPDGAHWRIPVAAAIAAIEAGRWSFYIERRGRPVPVVVAVSKYGSKYLKCADDPLQPESLLGLPDRR